MSAADFAARHWYRLGVLSLALFPLSLLFRALAALRRAGYRAGLLKSARLSVPVVVFGNLVAGGTGKTPLVIWAAQLLRARGGRPGIVLRGHGGS
ncbi:MAG TPA: tetraacyldisaccharide 4'-kinase, partial [Burkholderiales bacterium]|nr:tetraacyldisaccharide 4'-kinase [Burkholderiales bacterium]